MNHSITHDHDFENEKIEVKRRVNNLLSAAEVLSCSRAESVEGFLVGSTETSEAESSQRMAPL